MKNLIYNLILAITGVVFLNSCQPKFYEIPASPSPSAGTVSLNSYIAVGGAITAGFADNALYRGSEDGSGLTLADGGQGAAYPNLIAQQIKIVNANLSYNQPDVNSPVGWASVATVNGVGGNWGKRQLAYPFAGTNGVCNTAPVQPQNIVPSDLTGIETYGGDKSKLTNLAVPFLKVNQLKKNIIDSSASSTKPYKYWSNIISATGSTITNEAVSRNASLFTLWIGYDDFLAIAKSGVVTATGLGIDTTGLHSLVSGLLSNAEAKGAIAKIPYVDQFPIITNSNRRLTSATDPGSYPGSRTVNGKIVKRLPNSSLTGFNTALGSNKFTVDSTSTKNNYVITKGADGSLAIINTSKDFVVNSSLIDALGVGTQDPLAVRSCTPSLKVRAGTGLSVPIKNADVLDADEIAALRLLIDQYNAALANIVAQYPDRLALVDLNSFFTKLTDPIYGIPYGTEIIRTNHPALGPDFGGFFSTDRTYPTPKGQALLANEFIKVINVKWGATIPTLDVDKYRANIIPD